MIEPTKENVRKASAIADFLNRIGYMPYIYSGRFRKETWEEYCKRLGIEVDVR